MFENQAYSEKEDKAIRWVDAENLCKSVEIYVGAGNKISNRGQFKTV